MFSVVSPLRKLYNPQLRTNTYHYDKMHLTQLSLTNFRNYSRLDLSLPRHMTLLQGENAQGKTNFLEAIHYLITARSSHASTNQQLINWLADEEVLPYARLEGQIERQDAPCRVSITVMKEPVSNGQGFRLRRQIELNGLQRMPAQFLGELLVVFFSPHDIDLVDGSPSGRRRFLDVALCQLDSQYCQSLRRYNATLAQRNSLLRYLRRGRGRRSELEVWDEQLISPGAYLIAHRWHAVDALDRLSQPFHGKLTDGQERLGLYYAPSFDPTQAPPLNYQLPLPFGVLRTQREAWSGLQSNDIAAAFREKLRNVRKQEIEQGVTLIGPQRDDIHFLVNGVDMTTYGSRGQQRTTALSLQLAQHALMIDERGEEPILLLDDVMSELDNRRRTALMALIDGTGQVIITTTTWEDFPPDFLTRTHCLTVRAGQIKPAGPEVIPPDGGA